MSRVGTQPVKIPEKTTVKVDGREVVVTGPLGSLEQLVPPEIKVKVVGDEVVVERLNNTQRAKALHGSVRSLIANMVLGVTKGWQKVLEIHGTGYRARLEGEKLVFSLGFSHPVEVQAPEGIKFELKGERELTIKGIDKVLVGNLAAKVRKIRPPDAYKGKGIRYQGERVKLKPGKAGKMGAAGAA